MTGTSIDTERFPDRVYVALPGDADGTETLLCAFAPEDMDGSVQEVGVYRFESTLVRQFVERVSTIEQRADTYLNKGLNS